MQPTCEIIYVKGANGWKWRPLVRDEARPANPSDETYALFYDCVRAARASGFKENVKCL